MPSTAHSCRSCGAMDLAPILDLGRTPLANSLPTADSLHLTEPTYPLELVYCPHCSLVQITETVPPEELFRDYLYFSSFSDTMLASARELVAHLVDHRRLNRESLVIELASNDGYLLQNYCDRGVPVLGIEPARNIARVAEERGIPTLCEFFGRSVGERLAAQGRRADVLHANNVLAHVADLNGFVAGIAAVLKADGVAVIEVPYVKDMIDHVEFDTIYHEHLCYFSLTALGRLFHRHGLDVVDIERLPIHGGSLRVFVSHAGTERAPAVPQFYAEEAAWGVDRLSFYQDFAERVNQLKDALRNQLFALKRAGKRVAAYGASAKGSTLLHYCNIGRETLDFIVDRSTVKQGRYTPGTHLPILSPDVLLHRMPDCVLLLTWNFAAEILAQQEEYRRRGGRFLIPIPQLRVA